jgi:hypothetical protein
MNNFIKKHQVLISIIAGTVISLMSFSVKKSVVSDCGGSPPNHGFPIQYILVESEVPLHSFGCLDNVQPFRMSISLIYNFQMQLTNNHNNKDIWFSPTHFIFNSAIWSFLSYLIIFLILKKHSR